MSIRALRRQSATVQGRRWISTMFFGSTLAAALVYVAAIALAEPLLTERHPVAHAQMIVVLGGDGPSRAARAAQLWRQGVARDVLVTGDGDCTHIRDAMIADGVIADAIQIECLSGSTRENARFSAPILNRADIGEAVLVTSWFHTRRALKEFRTMCPGIEWASMPAEAPEPAFVMTTGPYGPAIIAEYVKTLAYGLQRLIHAAAEDRPGQGRCLSREALP